MRFRLFSILGLIILTVLTVALCISNPKMHKPFQLNIIEYILKINADGSVTSTKSVTTTVIKQEDR